MWVCPDPLQRPASPLQLTLWLVPARTIASSSPGRVSGAPTGSSVTSAVEPSSQPKAHLQPQARFALPSCSSPAPAFAFSIPQSRSGLSPPAWSRYSKPFSSSRFRWRFSDLYQIKSTPRLRPQSITNTLPGMSHVNTTVQMLLPLSPCAMFPTLCSSGCSFGRGIPWGSHLQGCTVKPSIHLWSFHDCVT